MIRFRLAPASSEPSQTSIAVGVDLNDALRLFGQQQDCLGCSTAIATTLETPAGVVRQVRQAFSPHAQEGPTVRPSRGAKALLHRGGGWTEVDIDLRAVRLRTVRMPSELVGAQRLMAVSDLRQVFETRPIIAIGLWSTFAHPVVRAGARFGGVRDGLTAEIALAVHPDRYILIDADKTLEATFVLATPDIVVAELLMLALRESRARHRGAGPWEDPLVQASTDLDLGVRNAEDIDIDALISPTLPPQQRDEAVAKLVRMAELLGVGLAS